MAEEIKKDVIIDFKTNDADKAQKELEKTKKSVGSVKKETGEYTKTTEKANEANKKTPGILKKVRGGIKGLGMAFKALGIGLVVALVAKLTEILGKNQKVVDAFNVVMQTVSNVINEVITAFQTAITNVSEATGGFDAMKKVVGGLLTLALTPLKTSFYAIKLAVQQAMLAWEQSFFGDGDQSTINELNKGISKTKKSLKEVGEDAIQAGKDIKDNYSEALGEIGELGKAVGDNLSEISIKGAQADANRLVQLRKNIKLQEAELEGLTLKYLKQAEDLRQIRDDEEKSIEARIKANKDLGDLLIEQAKEEKQIAQNKVSLLQQEIEAGDTSVETQAELIRAKNAILEIDERITGQRSEQLTNEVALRREREQNLNQLEQLGKSAIELSKEEARVKLEENRKLIERTVEDEKRKNELLKLANQDYKEQIKQIEAEEREKQLEKEAEEKERLKEKFNSELEQEKQNFQTRFSLIQQQRQKILDNQKINEEQRTALLKNNSKARLKVEEAEADAKEKINEQVKQSVIDGASALAEAVGLGKEFAIASALIDTYQGIAAGVKLGFPMAIPAVAAAAATGFAAVKNITSVDTPAPSGGGGDGRSGGGQSQSAPPTPPSFNLVGQANTSSITQSENIGGDKPVNAVVVSREVSSQQQADRNAQQQSSF